MPPWPVPCDVGGFSCGPAHGQATEEQWPQGTYEHDMEALFAEHKELFPKGASSLDVIAIDLVFKGLNIPREMGGEKIRITSLSEPMRTLEHKDRYGRPRRLDIWHMEFSDQVLLMYSTPTPTGLLGVLMQTGSAKIETWTYDLKKILDFLYVPYTARLKDWGPYLALRSECRPEAFKELRFTFEVGKSLETLRTRRKEN